MGYYVSNMIGIRTGGVFSDKTDMVDFKTRVAKVIASLRGTDNDPDIRDDRAGVQNECEFPLHCMSDELTAHKGCYVVIAGVFNYWRFESVSVFARLLSIEFGTEIMVMSWNEEKNSVQCQVYLAGNPLFEVNENAIGRVLRRVAGP